jgi:S1-C subfamily serine protease/rhodanese-related sulfurtransferase
VTRDDGGRVMTIRRRRVGRPLTRACLRFVLAATLLMAPGLVRASQTPVTTDVLLKVKPSAVIVMTKISGEVRLACPNGRHQRVVTEPIQAHGTGFLITADGYLVTNGHVVQPYYEPNDSEVRGALLRQAIEQACVPANLPEEQKRRAAKSLVARLAVSAAVEVKKSLTVVLSSRETFVAEVKAYSPPLAERPGKQETAGRGPVTESGKDVAILKIDSRNLPTVTLGDSDGVQLGQPIHLLGFPGVVMYHDLLDKRSAVEASITSGQISSVKRDTRGAPVIQTDAAASWGNSGGPAINEEGQVVGILTFISLTSDDTQAIQGFNFLVPSNIVREFARTAGADLGAPSPFNAVWHDAVDRFRRKDWVGAQAKLDAASRLVPNLPDVQRLQAETELRLLQDKRSPIPLVLGASVAAVLAIVGGACWWGWRRRRAGHAPAKGVAQAPQPELVHPVVRVSAADLARALAQRADLVLVDVREPSAYEKSSVQAKGAIRASAADILQVTSALAREQGIVLYCNFPGEVTSAEAARRLNAEGYTRVAVLTGGFAAWEAASLPVERTPHARRLAGGAQPALPAPRTEARPAMDAEVDLPVGVKGTGPYFNARATRLGLTGLSLSGPEALTVGQRLRLTVFLAGEPLEVSGQVVAADSRSTDGKTCAAEVAFESLSEDHATALEGFLLAQRTTR